MCLCSTQLNSAAAVNKGLSALLVLELEQHKYARGSLLLTCVLIKARAMEHSMINEDTGIVTRKVNQVKLLVKLLMEL